MCYQAEHEHSASLAVKYLLPNHPNVYTAFTISAGILWGFFSPFSSLLRNHTREASFGPLTDFFFSYVQMLYCGLLRVPIWTPRLLAAGVSSGTSILKSAREKQSSGFALLSSPREYSNPEETSA